MALDIYWTILLVLLLIIALLISRTFALGLFTRIATRWRPLSQGRKSHHLAAIGTEPTTKLLPDLETPPPSPPPPTHAYELCSFRRNFLAIYLLAMTPETLAGPYLWSLLRDDKGLPEAVVVALFATAYTSAAVSALVVGFLADRYGRRKACLVQCVFHATGCATVVFGGGECLPVLFVGRVLAGVGLTLLWTVFESWMVTEWNARGLENKDGGSMSEMFGMMTLWNCACAILGGVLCHSMVSILGSKMWPFGSAIILQGIAVVLIFRNMNENFGLRDAKSSETYDDGPPDIVGRGRFGDVRIWALTLATCCFEGTTFLVVFFWPSVLKSAHNDADAGNKDSDIPYGVISAALMAAMIIGALSFNAGCSPSSSPTRPAAAERGHSATRTPVCLLLGAVAAASASLLSLSILQLGGGSEAAHFCMFLVFEVANGVYTPSMAYIRGLVVDERGRTGLYGLMKIPLFVFVILALGVTAEDARLRRYIFASASFCLLLGVGGLVMGFFKTLSSFGRASAQEASAEVQSPFEKLPLTAESDVDGRESGRKVET
ncbi:unnamed protein product [Discula destructiva]